MGRCPMAHGPRLQISHMEHGAVLIPGICEIKANANEEQC